MNTQVKAGLFALTISTMLTAQALAATDHAAAAAEPDATPVQVVRIGDIALPVSGLSLNRAEKIVLAASNTLRRKRVRTPTFKAVKMRKNRMPGKLAPNSRGGRTQGPAEINCDIESSEECEKIVICEPNCSTEQMQGGDCC